MGDVVKPGSPFVSELYVHSNTFTLLKGYGVLKRE